MDILKDVHNVFSIERNRVMIIREKFLFLMH